MTDWLLAQGHWAFIVLAYGVFAVALAIDWTVPALRQRQLLRELRAMARRAKDKT